MIDYHCFCQIKHLAEHQGLHAVLPMSMLDMLSTVLEEVSLRGLRGLTRRSASYADKQEPGACRGRRGVGDDNVGR
jgi:hypothetical protein